jgi:predicted RNase H-like HicB family nuclease
MSRSYMAKIEAAGEGGFWVEFPELPGCFSQGESFEEALDNAREALEGWLEAVEAAPEPGDPARIARAIVRAGGVPAAIAAPDAASRELPVSISMAEGTLARIDRAAERQGLSRSAYMTQAALLVAAQGVTLGKRAAAARKRRKSA